MKLTGVLTTRSPQSTHRRSEPRGQGLVELALVIPVLIIIVVGALDLGRVFFSIITVTNVAREGVRYLTLHPEDRLVITENAVCYDLDASMQPNAFYKPRYFCTIEAAKQEAQTSLGAPVVIDPQQILFPEGSIFCLNVDTADFGCDRGTEAYVTARYLFRPVSYLLLADMFNEGDTEDGLYIVRTARMMVP